MQQIVFNNNFKSLVFLSTTRLYINTNSTAEDSDLAINSQRSNDYYNILNDSRVLFNCALQDWVSNTVSEADALGCNVLYPAYRSFPEVFANDAERMYVPWSQEDAIEKLLKLTYKPINQGVISDWTDGTIDRMVDIMEGKGEQWLRSGNRYRDHIIENKY